MDMLDDEDILSKKCYKFEESVLANLDIVYNSSNSKIVLWNKYQIFVYDGTEFESVERTFLPDFQIHQVIPSNNYLVCLDCSGNVHITPLKLKSFAPKSLKIPFQPRYICIKTCIKYCDDHILSLKYDMDTYFLCLHRINSEFQIEKKILLLCNSEHWPIRQSSVKKYYLTSCAVNKDNLQQLLKIFKTEESGIITDLIVLSFDKLTVYGCLFSPKIVEDTITLVKLYSCPAEICNIVIMDSGQYILIGLTMGTIIRLSLNDISKAPQIVHLNIALYKMIALKESLIYTDGVTMWKSENTFTKDINFTQFFVYNANDFATCGDLIVCTTFSKLIYKFTIEDRNVYRITKTNDEYCSAELILINSDYLTKLFEEIDRNNELVKKLSREEDYITALSLSNRQDVVGNAIDSSVMVFEDYSETSNTEFTLTEEMKEYFEPETWLFLVKMTNTNIYTTLNSILFSLSESIIIHVTFSSPHKVFKTTIIKTEEPLKTINLLIPLNIKNNETEISVNIKLVVKIPGTLDKKQTWTVLYRKHIVLGSEYFIKSKTKLTNCLKSQKESIEDLILKTALIQNDNCFKFIDKYKEKRDELSLYVKLPKNYEQIKTEKFFKKHFSCTKSTYLIQQWNNDEFLRSKNHIYFTIGNEKLKIKIENDGFSNPLLKITGQNLNMAFNLRNFFSKMIHNDYECCEPGNEFINYTFYTTAENLQKAVKHCITSSATFEEFLPLMNQFERNIIGALPI